MGMMDSFKQAHADEKVVSNDGIEGGDVQRGETQVLKRQLKGRHMQMIAIGGSIGAGLFVGSGKALASGGPANLVSYLTSSIVLNTFY